MSEPADSLESHASILVVDDDDLTRRAIGRVLTRGGHSVVEVVDAPGALRAIDGREFDVILSDLMMPGMSGLDLLRATRARALDTPVILMTGAPELQNAVEALRCGATDFVSKPIEREALDRAIQRALRAARWAQIKREALLATGLEMPGRESFPEIGDVFERALAGLYCAYQPIVRADGTTFGYEALLRSREPSLPHPGAVLGAAERLRRVRDVGRCIRRVAGAEFCSSEHGTLFVNLHPEDLLDPELVDRRGALAGLAEHVVLEITERAALDGLGDIRTRIEELRHHGYRIAVDDLGAGYAGLTSFAQLEPEVVKIDMSLVRGIDRSPTRQKIVTSVCRLAAELDIQVVAEGIETPGELETVRLLGVELFQGYLFARPAPGFPTAQWPASRSAA